jgi:hypothetical protein
MVESVGGVLTALFAVGTGLILAMLNSNSVEYVGKKVHLGFKILQKEPKSVLPNLLLSEEFVCGFIPYSCST